MKKSMTRKITVILLAFSLLCPVLFTGCGETPAETKDTIEAITTEAPSETDEETVLTQQTPETEETTPETEETPTETAEETAPETSDIPKTETPVTAEPTHSHKYAVVNNTPATCTQKGSVQYRCETCGDTYTKTTDMAAHSYGAWQTLSPVSCAVDGKQSRTCLVCGHEDVQVVKAGGHQAEVVEELVCGAVYSCKRCGERYTIDFSGGHHFEHQYDRYRPYLLVCTDCGLKFDDLYNMMENAFSQQDRTAAMYTDAITLKKNDGGPMAKWPERWIEYYDIVTNTLKGFSCIISLEDFPELSGFDALVADYRAFSKAYADLFGWTPQADIDEEMECFFFDEAMSDDFTAKTKNLSAAQQKAAVDVLAAYWIYDSGVYDGMQLYNAVGQICDYMARIYVDLRGNMKTAYQAMLSQRAASDGYAAVFNALCEYCGITAESVKGRASYLDGWIIYNNVPHTWNKVTFSDGTVRYVDVSLNWNDYLILVPKERLIDHAL